MYVFAKSTKNIALFQAFIACQNAAEKLEMFLDTYLQRLITYVEAIAILRKRMIFLMAQWI
jgi:hypothetical protein